MGQTSGLIGPCKDFLHQLHQADHDDALWSDRLTLHFISVHRGKTLSSRVRVWLQGISSTSESPNSSYAAMAKRVVHE